MMTYEERLRYDQVMHLVECLYRSNIDWNDLAKHCGDLQCDGDCWYVREVQSIVADLRRR